jgi:enterochelin esterase family protein
MRSIQNRLLYVLILAGIMISGLNAQQSRPAAPARPSFRMGPVIVSPEMLPDNKVTFRLLAPKATEVTITGEWMQGFNAGVPMVKNDTGLWTLTVGPLNPELYAYNFIIDGVTAPDPNNVQVRRDGSRYQSFFIIPGKESDLYIQKENVRHGNVEKVWYKSDVLGINRRLYVYTPAGYSQSMQKYPVFYLLHGAGGDEDAWTNMGRAAQIMDNLIAQGKAQPMIVVMTNGNANQAGAQNEIPQNASQRQFSMADYQKYVGKFEESLVKDVIPFIESNYRTYTDKSHRAIAGLSMGGMHTQTITLNNPGMFDYIGVFSMGLMNFGNTQNPEQLAKERDEKIEALKKSDLKVYWIGCGKEDFLFNSVIDLRNTLDKHNFKYTYRESTGGHTWANWRIYLSEFSPLLFKSDYEYKTRNDWANFSEFAEDNQKLGPPAKGEKRVVFMGNSITIGWIGACPEFFDGKSYIDRGISGQTTPQMLIRFRPDVINLKPAAVVILAGINDIAGNTGPSTLEMIEDNLAGMAEMAKANGIKVILCSVLPAYDFPWRPGMEPADKVVQLNNWIKSYAAANNYIYVDYYSKMVDERKGLKAEYTYDGVHPNKAGYQVMQPIIEEAIKKALK